MTLAPLLGAPALIRFHAFTAMSAMVLGIVQFAAPNGTLPHRSVVWAWVVLMATVAISSFWITEVAGEGHYSWSHLLSVVTLVALVFAVRAARRGAVRSHQRRMLLLFIGALLITGLFTILPGRIMHRVVFGG